MSLVNNGTGLAARKMDREKMEKGNARWLAYLTLATADSTESSRRKDAKSAWKSYLKENLND